MLHTLPHNHRALQIFRYIQKHASFDWASVVDFGCGYGDLSIYAAMFGAQRVYAIDKDPKMIRIVEAKAESLGFGDTIILYHADLVSMTNETLGFHDYGFCMSVLPYLDAHDQVFFLIDATTQVGVLFLECQYAGDGPGLDFIHNDDEMAAWLGNMGIEHAKIGETIVKEGRYHRSIWMCTNERYKDHSGRIPKIGEHVAVEASGRLPELASGWSTVETPTSNGGYRKIRKIPDHSGASAG